ncbi:hypothetical protein TCON_1778 [Astathelohania contejeani]|uniref:PH domain-containing protein n=1 Tax=Astathelohania contejeani TaxID=164912 RepID=A0ABQ7HY12_9MICR|nr:hypothetical protein TCON_1778 [Thelohania contejeani]
MEPFNTYETPSNSNKSQSVIDKYSVQELCLQTELNPIECSEEKFMVSEPTTTINGSKIYDPDPNWKPCITPTLYGPGEPLRVKPTFEMVHLHYSFENGKETSRFIFRVISDRCWLISKSLNQLAPFIKEIKGDIIKSKNPYKLELRSKMIPLLLNKNLSHPSYDLQGFITTDIIEKYELVSGFLRMKTGYFKKWTVFNVKIIGEALTCYEGSKLRKVYDLRCCDVYSLNDDSECLHAFVILFNSQNNVVFCASSEEEKNEWVRILRRAIYVK